MDCVLLAVHVLLVDSGGRNNAGPNCTALVVGSRRNFGCLSHDAGFVFDQDMCLPGFCVYSISFQYKNMS